MDVLGVTHTSSAVLSLLLGPAVFFRRKGDRLHRRIGYGYAVSMVVMLATALMIYDLFGRWGPFHYAAVASTATLAMGLVPAILRRPRAKWLEIHYVGMCWSYAGLAAAAVAETFTRLPDAWPALGASAPMTFFWAATGVGSTLVMVVAVYLIRIRRLGFPRDLRASAPAPRGARAARAGDSS